MKCLGTILLLLFVSIVATQSCTYELSARGGVCAYCSFDDPSCAIGCEASVGSSLSDVPCPLPTGADYWSCCINGDTCTPNYDVTVCVIQATSLSPSPTPSLTSSRSTSAQPTYMYTSEPTVALDTPSSNGNIWLWWIIVLVAFCLICCCCFSIPAAIFGFIVFNQRQQNKYKNANIQLATKNQVSYATEY